MQSIWSLSFFFIIDHHLFILISQLINQVILSSAMESGISDAKFEAMLDNLRVIDPQLRCPSGNKITKICSNPQCKISLNCGQYKCQHCGGQMHKYCQFFHLEMITELLNERAGQSKELVEKIRQIDNQLIKSINDSQKELTSEYHISPFPEDIQKIVNQIYKNRSLNAVSGADGKFLFQQIEEINSASSKRSLTLLQEYKKAIDNIISEVRALKRSLCSREQLKMKMQSVILKENDPKSKEMCEFISKELNNPKELVLLYRASENNFSAKAFHQKCGDKANTLTLVRTEFGKTIAAFTPYAWHSVPNSQYVNNPAGGCFILALENRQKLIPHGTDHLIKNESENGPIFGNGWDMRICDQCNNRKNSKVGYIKTYNTVDNKYQRSQATYTALSGVTDGYQFLVLQYQIFEVVK